MIALAGRECVAQVRYTAADQRRLAKVDIGLQHHLRRFYYEPTAKDPLIAFESFFVPHAMPAEQARTFKTQYRDAQRDFAQKTRERFFRERNDEFLTVLRGKFLENWKQTVPLFAKHNAAHAKDVAELLSEYRAKGKPAEIPSPVVFGVVDLVAACGQSESERLALSKIRERARTEFSKASGKIQQAAFKRLKRVIERLNYSKQIFPFECEADRQRINGETVKEMLEVFPPERRKSVAEFVNTFTEFELRVQSRNKTLSAALQGIDPDAHKLLPTNLLVHSYDPFQYLFGIGTEGRTKQLSNVHFKHLRISRQREREFAVSFIAQNLPPKHGENYRTVMSVLDDFFVQRDAIWNPFLARAGIRTGVNTFGKPEFDYRLAKIVSACKLPGKERTALRKLDQSIASEHRRITTETLKARGWKLFYRKVSDTRPETVAYWEDKQRVEIASTVLRERTTFQQAAELISADKRGRFKELADSYSEASNEFRLLLRDRIAKIEASIGTNALRGCDLPDKFARPREVSLVVPASK